MSVQIKNLDSHQSGGKAVSPSTNTYKSWLLFITLSIVWGSSFILMKEGLLFLNPFQVASLRIIFAGMVLLPWALQYLKGFTLKTIFLMFLSGILGSLFPAYLFCIAEQKIDSALAGTLNALTPVFVIITGALFFKISISKNKIIGIGIAFFGSVLLLFVKGSVDYSNHLNYTLLIILATLSYGLNVNMVHKFLNHIPSIKIASIGLALSSFPAIVILYESGFFNLNWGNRGVAASIGFTAVLGLMGTALATILYYILLKISGAIFSSMVTYCIPVVANMWGVFLGESIGIFQSICLLLILAGVYFANSKMPFKFKMSATAK